MGVKTFFSSKRGGLVHMKQGEDFFASDIEGGIHFFIRKKDGLGFFSI